MPFLETTLITTAGVVRAKRWINDCVHHRPGTLPGPTRLALHLASHRCPRARPRTSALHSCLNRFSLPPIPKPITRRLCFFLASFLVHRTTASCPCTLSLHVPKCLNGKQPRVLFRVAVTERSLNPFCHRGRSSACFFNTLTEISFNHYLLELHLTIPFCARRNSGGSTVQFSCHSGTLYFSIAPTFPSLVVATNALRISHCGSRVHPRVDTHPRASQDPLLSSTSSSRMQ